MPVDTQPQKSWIERNPKKVLFCFLLVSTLILDPALTGVYHFFKYGTIHKYADRRALGEKSPVFHHTLKPNARFSYQRWGHTRHSVTTNSLGFRDTAVHRVPLSSDKHRILFMGDSFVYGVGLAYDKTFVCLVASELGGKDVEVLNGGVVSYSPAIYFKKTEHLVRDIGLRFDHLVVFLDISDIHDEAEFYDTTDERVIWIRGPTPVIREFVFEYTTLARNVWEITEELYDAITDDPDTHRTEEDRQYGANEYRSLWTVDESAYSDYGAVGLEKAKKHMNLLHSLLRRNGIPMTLVVYPWPTQILHEDLDSIQVRVWREWACEHSVDFIDFFPSFIKPGKDPREVIRKYFIPGDIHWNEEGHRLVAARLLNAWASNSPSMTRSSSSD
jgi:hypothetical protein